MHVHKSSLPRFARGDVVKANDGHLITMVRKARQSFIDLRNHFGLYRLVHQALRRTPDEMKAFFQNIEGHRNGH